MALSGTILFGCRVKTEKYARFEDRLSTYKAWPRQMKQNKHDLAKAGFFYTKEGDTVECFVCGVSVSQWKATDFSVFEHRKWSPNCAYLKLTTYEDCSSHNQPSLEEDAFTSTNSLITETGGFCSNNVDI